MSGFSYPQPIFQSNTYNPAFYLSLDPSGFLSYEYAQTLYLSKNDYRLSYITGITPSVATAGVALVLGNDLSLTGLGELSCASLSIGGVAVNTSAFSSISGVVAGTASASKALILDSSLNIAGINSISLSSSASAMNITNSGTTNSSITITQGSSTGYCGISFVNNGTSTDTGSWTIQARASSAVSLPGSLVFVNGAGGNRTILDSSGNWQVDANLQGSNCISYVAQSTTVNQTKNKLLIGLTADSTASRRIISLDTTLSSTNGTSSMIMGYATSSGNAATFSYGHISDGGGYGAVGLFGSSNTIQWNIYGRVYIGASSIGQSIAERLVVAGAQQADFYYDRLSGGEPRPVFAIRNPQSTDVSAEFPYSAWGSHNDTTRGIRFQRASPTFAFDTTAGSGYATLYCSGTSNPSDYRVKKNVEPIPYGLSQVLMLKPIIYELKNDDAYGKQLGFIAHEVQEQIPELVEGIKDDVDSNGNIRMQSMIYERMVSVLVKAIQEQQSIIEKLEELRLADYNRLDKFQMRLSRIETDLSVDSTTELS